MVVQFALGWVLWAVVRGTFLRHAFCIFFGLFLQSYMYGYEIIYVFLISACSYLAMRILPRQKQNWVIVPVLMAIVLWNHIQTMLTFDGKYPIDVSTFTMLQVCRFWALSFSFRDGDPKCPYKLEAYQSDHAVRERPTFLEIMSYTFFCCGASIGVFFEYSDYIKFIKMEGHYQRIPCPIIRSLGYLLAAFAFAGINKFLEQWFSDFFVLSAEFEQWSLPKKYAWMYLYNFCFRTFYYSAFMLQNGALIASGFGYNGQDEKTKTNRWDTVVSIYLLKVETGESAIKILQAWNHQVHVWLKYYVQHRLVKHGEHPAVLATCATFMVSALWHGVYPMYFFCFFYIFALQELSKDLFKAGDKIAKVWPFNYSQVRYFSAYFVTSLNCSFFCLMWRLRSPQNVWQFWQTTLAIPVVGVFALLLLSRSTGFSKAQKAKTH